MAVGVIVGSAFDRPVLDGSELRPEAVETPFGAVTVYRHPDFREAVVLFRHGVPHRFLPHQIPHRAHAAALRAVGCQAVLVTSSVGVLVKGVPLFQPLWVEDLLMLENRLPDGSACSMFVEPCPEQGHLVIEGGLFSKELSTRVGALAKELGTPLQGPVVFAYVGGPRTKTSAENTFYAATGAHVNSMSVAPEVVLLNELEIATAAVVVGHKSSVANDEGPVDRHSITESLRQSRRALEALLVKFMHANPEVPFGNRLHRMGDT